MKQYRMRTVTVAMTYMFGAVLLAGGCTREESAAPAGREAVILSIAEANYGALGGARRTGTSPADGGTPQTRAIVDGGGSTFFTDGDRLGLFLRGDGYEDVDNRIVQLDYPGEGPQKKWKITGEAIPLYADAATVTAYFPYSDAYGLTMSAVPLNSGPYDVNTNDVVWQRDTVHSTHTQAMFLEMQHAMTRVKIRLNRGTSDTSDSGDYTGEGKITGVRIADAGDVAADDRVVYLDGTLDLTQATPVVTPGWPDAVADKSEKTLTAEGVLYDLLLLPVDKIDAGKVMLEVELDGKSLSAPFPVDAVDKWEAGKAYTYEVAVRNGAAQVVFGKATVTPWNDGGSISGDLDPSKPEYGGGDVQDWGDNEWGAEEGGDEPVTGEIADASLVPPPTDNVIPLEGGEYSVRLTGNWTGSVSVRMSVGGNIGGLLHAVCSNGAATVTFTVPANTNSSRTVTFEYLWNGTWIKIGNACTQQGYNVTAATHNAPATIPGLGGSYNVTLTGYLPSAGIEVRASSGGTALVTGKVTASGTAVSLRVPANLSYNTRTVTFEYLWNGTWTKIGNDCTQQGWHVTKASVSPAGDIPGAGGTYTVTLTGWGGYQVRAMSGSTELVIKTDFTEVANYSATIKIPAHTSLPTKRSVTFQYRFNGTWTDIETRTQYADLSNGVYFRNCENFCSHRGGLPTIDELRSYLWDGWPTTLQPDNTPLYYWSKYSGNAAVHVYAPATNVTSTLLYANEQNHAMCRCRDE
ncbi:fimbrillin family protein [Alistipes finegoldii]|uniref:fimbrillin family protein n=3 Tax=Alistipes finegoldii TaxID=214856 RepID=UPI0024955A53|nr:fimbrillin family protein [Alistipes finegoldii]